MNKYCVICDEDYINDVHINTDVHLDNVDGLKAMLACIDDICEASLSWPTKRIIDFRTALIMFVNPRNSYFSKVYSFLMLSHIDKVLYDRIETKEWIRKNLLIKDVSDIVISYMD